MIARFDSLNRFEVPKMYLCSPGSTYNNGIINGVSGILTETSDEELVLNFNAISELNFRAKRVHYDDPEENAYAFSIYKSIQNRRMIFLDDVGFFSITQITDGFSDGVYYKDVKAESCEVEIQNKMLPFVNDGTYQFMQILEVIIRAIPLWSIGHVDDTVAEKYRTFEDIGTDINCLGFMVENMQDAYECIFSFDCVNRVVNVYDQNNYVMSTSIHITKDDVINSIEISEDSGDLYTAISVLGDEELNIAPVNPLGTSTIYNFDYYIPWMSAELQSRVTSWKALISSSETSYYNANLSYYNLLTQRSTKEANLSKLETQLTMYRRCRENIIAESDTSQVSGYNTVIVDNGGTPIEIGEDIATTVAAIDDLIAIAENEYSTTQSELTTINNQISVLREQISAIQSAVNMENYFVTVTTHTEIIDGESVVIEDRDTHLLDELMNYIYEGSYTDEYITVTDVMTYSEKFEQMKTLYDRAIGRLERVSQPSQEFSIDVENFIFVKDFQSYSEQLETGCLINVELEDDDVAMLFLSSITVNYDDGTLKLTFGNRFTKFDPKALFENALGDIQKSANTLNYIKEVLYPIKNGEFNEMKEAIENSRTLTKNAALASSNEEVVIDDTGYTGRKMLENGRYDPHQVKLTGTNLVFTDDAWDTCKVALGQLIMGEGTSAYGINAEMLIGDLIMGNNLQIVDNNGNDILTVVDGMINTSISDVNGRLSQIEQTADQVEIRVQSLENEDREQDHITTAVNRYTFNDSGLTIHRDGDEIENKIDNTGMYVNRGEDNVLTVNNEGVEAINIRANQFLIIGGVARFEQYNDASLNENRTACFYIGG